MVRPDLNPHSVAGLYCPGPLSDLKGGFPECIWVHDRQEGAGAGLVLSAHSLAPACMQTSATGFWSPTAMGWEIKHSREEKQKGLRAVVV